MLIPINSGLGTYKGIVDVQNTIFCIANIDKRIIPEIKIIFNNIRDNENTNNINDWLKEKEYINLLMKTHIRNSDTCTKTENDWSSIWENPYYWGQKQAYEKLIKEIK